MNNLAKLKYPAREVIAHALAKTIIAMLIVLIGNTMPPMSGSRASAADPDFVPQPGKFPPPGVGVYYAGELVSVDHVNRRAAIRFVGDNDDGRYHSAPAHKFAMLPYGTIRYHGAPAELRDVPIGTLLHGYFVLPPAGDATFPDPGKKPPRYVVRHTHALSLEDDFSFYQRRGQAWKILSIDREKEKLKVAATGPTLSDGLKGEPTFEFDSSTRVWKGRQFAELTDIAAGQEVQMNFTWAPDWKNGQLHVADIWLDQESRDVATEMQRRTHVRHQRTRWLAGWVDHVEHQSGGKGIVTVTLFGGMDPSLYEAVRVQHKAKASGAIAAAENTLRSWWQEHDNKSGKILEVKDVPDSPAGSTGLQVRVQINELLEGFRPTRIVRFRPNGFPNVKLPQEERIQSLEQR